MRAHKQRISIQSTTSCDRGMNQKNVQILQILLVISTFCNTSNKFNKTDLMLFKGFPKEYM